MGPSGFVSDVGAAAHCHHAVTPPCSQCERRVNKCGLAETVPAGGAIPGPSTLVVGFGFVEVAWAFGGRGIALVVAAGLVIVACEGGSPSRDGALGGISATAPGPNPTLVDLAIDGTLPLADEALDDPEVTTVATDLAASQLGVHGPRTVDASALCFV